MKFFKFLWRNCRGMMVMTIIAALVTGACNAGLIAMVNAALNPKNRSREWLAAGFCLLLVGKIVGQIISQLLAAHSAHKFVAELRRSLIRKILGVPLQQLEELGSSGILVCLTDDTAMISQAMLGMQVTAVNVAILLAGAVYMAWVSWQVFLAISVLGLVGGIGYRLMIKDGFHYLHNAREEQGRLFRHFRSLTEGIKELKLHRERRRVFLEDQVQNSTEVFQKHNIMAEHRIILAQNVNYTLYYLVVGLILFCLPLQTYSTQTLTSLVVTILYLMGPLSGVMSSLSFFGRANAALKKVEGLGFSLDGVSTEMDSIRHSTKDDKAVFQSLEIVNIVHSYHNEKEDTNFKLGPISLQFNPGELVFIVGGNGTGKSTLAKIITGLYFPEGGEIRWNGKTVDNSNRDEYRQIFSAVFSDFYLFDTLIGLNATNLDEKARDYLKQLHLNHKVKIENGNLSTTALSQGQRKRLALLTAYLEDRPLYLFDEWASDQDPVFKALFYTQLLPELKSRGKTVICISHDDKYFNVADRVIKLDYGKLAETSA